MRFLFILSELPFPQHRNGLALINYQILIHAPKDVEIDLLVTADPEPQLVEDLRAAAPQVGRVTMLGEARGRRFRIGNLISGAVLGFNAFRHVELKRWLQSSYGTYDAVYASPLIGCYDLRLAAPLLLNAVDSFSKLNLSFYRSTGKLRDKLKWKAYERYENRVLKSALTTSFVSHVDQAHVAAHSPELHTTCIPNGVDTEFFSPGTEARDAAGILFTGNFAYEPNAQAARYFASTILPLIRAERPDAVFFVVGKNPPADLHGMDGVVITGFIEDIRKHYRQRTIFACPLLTGAGMKNKVLEAMACGIPIVSTSLGVDGIVGLRPGETHILADAPIAFAQAVLMLLSNPSNRAALTGKARQLAVDHFGWQTTAKRYHEELMNVASRRASAKPTTSTT
jgi:polysaccharide biosynthesis protein PslH